MERYMKYSIVVFILLLLCSCSQPKYSVCIPTVHPDSIKTEIFPVSVGSFWIYEQIEYRSGKKDIVKTEIASLDTINVYVNENYVKILGYKLDIDYPTRYKNKPIQYYIKCDTKIQIATAQEYNPQKIISINDILFPVRDSIIIDPSTKNEQKITSEILNSRIGKLKCIVWEANSLSEPSGYYSNVSVAKTKCYYSKGIGLVRTEYLNKFGELVSERNLINYEVK
jgi:hypothetical protein